MMTTALIGPGWPTSNASGPARRLSDTLSWHLPGAGAVWHSDFLYARFASRLAELGA